MFKRISVALYSYITSLPATIKRVLFSSDSCNGQNRNQIYIHYVLCCKNTNLETIEVNFLEPGHAQMEADSMHSAIETWTKLFCMNDWEKVIPGARRTDKRIQPCVYHGWEYHQIYEFKEIELIKNKN